MVLRNIQRLGSHSRPEVSFWMTSMHRPRIPGPSRKHAAISGWGQFKAALKLFPQVCLVCMHALFEYIQERSGVLNYVPQTPLLGTTGTLNLSWKLLHQASQER